MLPEKQLNRFNEILEEIKTLWPDTTTSLKIVITADNTKVTGTYRHPEQLKKFGYSMRNIKGDFIKDIKPPQP